MPKVGFAPAVLIVTMFAVSGVLHLRTAMRCDDNLVSRLLKRVLSEKRPKCDNLARGLLVAAGALELVAAGAVVLSYQGADKDYLRTYAAGYLMAFTALVTVLFKVPRLMDSSKALGPRLVPVLSNMTTFGALWALYEGCQ